MNRTFTLLAVFVIAYLVGAKWPTLAHRVGVA